MVRIQENRNLRLASSLYIIKLPRVNMCNIWGKRSIQKIPFNGFVKCIWKRMSFLRWISTHRIFTQGKESKIFNLRRFSWKALYQLIVTKTEVQGFHLMKDQYHSHCPWVFFNNDKASQNSLVVRNALLIRKTFSEGVLLVSWDCILCIDMEKSIERAFFYCKVLSPLCNLIENYMVLVIHGQFITGKDSSAWTRRFRVGETLFLSIIIHLCDLTF